MSKPFLFLFLALALIASACSGSDAVDASGSDASESADDAEADDSEQADDADESADAGDSTGSPLGDPAAAMVTVNDEVLSRAELTEFLGEWSLINSGSPEVTTELAKSGIEFWVQVTSLGQDMKDEVTDEDFEIGEEWITEYVPQLEAGTPVFEMLRVWWATRLAVGRGEGIDTDVTEQQMRDQLDEINAAQPLTVCSSHVLVATAAEAEDVVARIDAGEDFGVVAGEVSTDTGSGANGGSLGCAAEGSFVEPFENAVWGGTEGDVVGPVESEFGFHVILHEGFDQQTFEYAEVEGGLRQAVIDIRFRPVDLIHERRALNSAENVDVTLDGSLGAWDPVTSTLIPS